MRSYYSFSWLMAIATIVSVSDVVGQEFSIIGVLPEPGTVNGARDDYIVVYFNDYLDLGTMTTSNFHCYGNTTGRHGYNYWYYEGTPWYFRFRYNPWGIYPVGEVVTAVVCDEMRSTVGVPLSKGYVWSYTVLTEGGTGVFDSVRYLPVAADPLGLTIADLNYDNRSDVVVCHRDIDRLSISYGMGAGNFSAPIDIALPSGSYPHEACAADFNNDTHLDLAVVLRQAEPRVLLNNGNGTFAERSIAGTRGLLGSIACGDFNGDGAVDLVVAGGVPEGISVLLNAGDATFPVVYNYDIPRAADLAVFDGDSDFDMDLAVSQWSAPPDSISTVTTLRNNGNGTFESWQSVTVDLGASNVVAADIDGDRDIDLITNAHYRTYFNVLRNAGDGSFGPRDRLPCYIGPTSAVAADFDADADIDLALFSYYGDYVVTYSNLGNGRWQDYSFLADSGLQSACAADVDNDGDVDLVATGNLRSNLAVLMNKDVSTGVDEPGVITPRDYRLTQNYPNPFNPMTTIEYSIPTRSHVVIELFNIVGQRIRTLVDETKPSGVYEAVWNGTNDAGESVSSGVYLYRLRAGDFIETKKMVLLK